MLHKLDKFHETRLGLGLFALLGLVVAYVAMSWAIDSGSWFDYILALVAIIVFLQNGIKLIRSLRYGQRRGRKTR